MFFGPFLIFYYKVNELQIKTLFSSKIDLNSFVKVYLISKFKYETFITKKTNLLIILKYDYKKCGFLIEEKIKVRNY